MTDAGRVLDLDEDKRREWDAADSDLDQVLVGSIRGRWEYVTIVASDPGLAPMEARLYGCPPGTHQRLNANIESAYTRLARAAGFDLAPWKLAISGIVVSFRPRLRTDFKSFWIDAEEAYSFSRCAKVLDSTAVERARHGMGPGPIASAAIEDVMESMRSDPVLPSRTVEDVAFACKRRIDRRLDGFVVNVKWGPEPIPLVKIHGDLTCAPDTGLFACGSGKSRVAANRLAAEADEPGKSPHLFVLVTGAQSKDLRVRATRDGEAAIRFLHVTEHARLAALGMLPKRVRRP